MSRAKVEKEHPEDVLNDLPPLGEIETPPAPEKRGRGRPRNPPKEPTGVVRSEAQIKQSLEAVARATAARAAKPLKKDIEAENAKLKKEQKAMEEKLEAAMAEAIRQKEKKRREKNRSNTLAELVAQQKNEVHPPAEPAKPSEQMSQTSDKTAVASVERPPSDPMDNPYVKSLIRGGASPMMAMNIARRNGKI